MLNKRIIPCLDVKNGRTVKGTQFKHLRDAGDPVALAKSYSESGADELVFLDITASNERRTTVVDLVDRVAREISIPFTVGGGIHSVETAYAVLRAGADKVTINTAAVMDPQLIARLAKRFGNQCVVVAIDARLENGSWEVYTNGGTNPTGLDLFDWAKQAQTLGAGEILFTAMNNDGEKQGFAVKALARLGGELTIPVIASGGAGAMADFEEVFSQGGADAALAASVFHFGEIELKELKSYLRENGIRTRNID